jgi:hypothetical protein
LSLKFILEACQLPLTLTVKKLRLAAGYGNTKSER